MVVFPDPEGAEKTNNFPFKIFHNISILEFRMPSKLVPFIARLKFVL
jgi:hypothetical protein